MAEKSVPKTDKADSAASFGVHAPTLSLPKGGGAIRGIGEKFAANPVTGTGSMSVPLATSAGRSGFGPQLAISYDSGAGNGTFGLGWNLALPAITRKTDRGLPQYGDEIESDVFVLSGSEDLVPILHTAATTRTVAAQTYRIRRYRPRIEGAFARIERWTNTVDPRDVFWRSITKDNITSWYGRASASRIADPLDPRRIFSWLLCESYDDKGNVLVYGYKAEDSANIDDSLPNERNRTHLGRSSNRYPKRICYGNRVPHFPLLAAGTPWPVSPNSDGHDASAHWYFEIVFDYGEHDVDAPLPDAEIRPWVTRHDPHSSYRSGFEVRTYRRCQRVLMFHHFPEEPGVGADCLVRASRFTYSDQPDGLFDPIYSLLLKVEQISYRREASGYRSRILPPLEFEYTHAVLDESVHEVDPQSLENVPAGLADARFQWVDLDGEGSAGILSEQQGAWYYKPNFSAANLQAQDGVVQTLARFGPMQVVRSRPSLASLSNGGQQLLSLAGNGRLDLVEYAGPAPGYFERNEEEDWEALARFGSLPIVNWEDPNLKFIDLTGDGFPDVLISESEAFLWYESLAKAGFGPAQRVAQALNEEEGPKLLFADGTESVFFADMSGDGLTDLVRIRNGEVCYWPNLGYGRFGAKVSMDDSPWFECAEIFDGRRIRLSDIDGSGTADLIYFGADGVRLYFNISGNAWGPCRMLSAVPPIDGLMSAAALDLLGNGTACLAWSSRHARDARTPMHYIKLMGDNKPHLLIKTVNNLGAETRIEYAPSTRFYVQDKLAGREWITRLNFPVHVVERVTTFDYVSRNVFGTRYAYHHGYFDPVEREFRGFGLVEQWDTQELAALSDAPSMLTKLAQQPSNIDATSIVPPVLTKTWYHTGAYFDEERISKQFEAEYYREGDALSIPGTFLPDTLLLADGSRTPWKLSNEEAREACRALKGSILRQEIYGLDGNEAASRPYSVTENNYTVENLQPREANRHAVFFAHLRESVELNYERKLYNVEGAPQGAVGVADPRIAHTLVLEVDVFGNTRRSVSISYGRRYPDAALAEADQETQRTSLITCTQSDFTNAVDATDAYRAPLTFQSRAYEVTGVVPQKAGTLFRFADWWDGQRSPFESEPEIAYEERPKAGKPQRRLIEQICTFYRPDDMGQSASDVRKLLNLGTLESLALQGVSYRLALTPGLLDTVYRYSGQPLPISTPLVTLLASTAADGGGYVDLNGDGHWWLSSGRVFRHSDRDAGAAQEALEARAHFYLPRRFEDAFGNTTTVTYQYDLAVSATLDAVGNTISAVVDHRVQQPCLLTDPNGNQIEVMFDTLGLPAGTIVMGKPGESLGDTSTNFTADLTADQIEALYDSDDPAAYARDLLGSATTRFVYNVERFMLSRAAGSDPASRQPAFAVTLARETHGSDLGPGEASRVQVVFSYSDGFGREIQKKIQAEPEPGDAANRPRWIGSGWTIFNNKGKPVRQYEPFFSGLAAKGQQFEFGTRVGVSPILLYDPVERVVATLYPNHTYRKTLFDPWQQITWDTNDTVTMSPDTDPDISGSVAQLPKSDYLPTWYRRRVTGELGLREQEAAAKAAKHAGTPTSAYVDPLGRPFLTIADNGMDDNGTPQKYPTRNSLDIQGRQREVRDSIVQSGDNQGRIVMKSDYDLTGTVLRLSSMEAGERWTLSDVAGKPIHAWDCRGHELSNRYDALRRPIAKYVRGHNADRSDPRTLTEAPLLVETIEYGEARQDAAALNLRTRIYRQRDPAGVITHAAEHPLTGKLEAYDFKGNLLRSSRQLTSDYRGIADWSREPLLSPEIFTSSTRFDALNRAVVSVLPYSNQAHAQLNFVQPVFNEANLLERLDVWLDQAAEPAAALNPQRTEPSPVGITNIDYNAKGQRTRVDYRNGVNILYEYDQQTFMLTRILARRPAASFPDDFQIQSLTQTYDPSGNITHIEDAAQQTIFFKNQRIEPGADYTYDPIYRLISAKGREHLGQASAPLWHSFNDSSSVAHSAVTSGGFSPYDGNAMGTYVESYVYDSIGNILKMQHRGAISNQNWQRTFEYAETSLIEDGLSGLHKTSNRLSSTLVTANGSMPTIEPYLHDVHGNMIRMPHLGSGGSAPNLVWDYQDRLQRCELGGGGVVYYQYDAAGARVRKVWEKTTALTEERIYLPATELFRRHRPGAQGAIGVETARLERSTVHVMDDTRRVSLVETRTKDTTGSDSGPARLIRYQLDDHLGSTCLELDEEARIVSYEEHTPFGSTSYQAVRSQTDAPKRYRYTGKERDTESGLYYFGARYYAPWLARWTSCDPSGISDGLQLYRYATNSPASLLDTSGRATEPPREVQYAPLGSNTGAASAQWYADLVVEGEKQGGFSGGAKVAGGWVGGFFASLWTPETATSTGIVLATAGTGALAGAGSLGFASAPIANTMAVAGSYEAGVSGVQAVTGKSSGAHIADVIHLASTGQSDAGRTLSHVERGLEALNAATGALAMGQGRVAEVRAKAQRTEIIRQQISQFREEAVAEITAREESTALRAEVRAQVEATGNPPSNTQLKNLQNTKLTGLVNRVTGEVYGARSGQTQLGPATNTPPAPGMNRGVETCAENAAAVAARADAPINGGRDFTYFTIESSPSMLPWEACANCRAQFPGANFASDAQAAPANLRANNYRY